MKYDAGIERAAIATYQAEPRSGAGRAAADVLVRMHMGVITLIVRRLAIGTVRLEDLQQEGALALLRSIPGFKAGFGKFTTYAGLTIRRDAIAFQRSSRADLFGGDASHQAANLLRRSERVGVAAEKFSSAGSDALSILANQGDQLRLLIRSAVRLDKATTNGPGTVGDLLADPGTSAEDLIDFARQRSAVEAALLTLSPKHREVIDRHYLADDPETLEDIGKSMGFSKQRADQIKKEALFFLRSKINRIPNRYRINRSRERVETRRGEAAPSPDVTPPIC